MDGKPRILVLWNHIPGYLAGCLEVLLDVYELPVLAIVRGPYPQPTHTRLQRFPHFKYVDLSSPDRPSERSLRDLITGYKPTLTVAGCGKWGVLPELARTAKNCGSLTIWAIDHYWQNSWRDYANAILANLGVIYNFYDAVWVAGSLGRRYARYLGFQSSRIFEGVLSCDTQLFRQVGLNRFSSAETCSWPKTFLFVGRYEQCKDIDTLIRAYVKYRNSVEDPWELWCVGSGSKSSVLQGKPGVKDLGYQTSECCAELMRISGTFILPSTFEPWGVVIHEATCAGLPILASRTCGAAANLVRDGYNGFTFRPEDDKTLAMLMQHISDGNTAKTMGQNSLRMSYQFDPKLWAETLLVHIPYRLTGRSLIETGISDSP